MNWLHRLLNPHCSFCIAEKEDARICLACESKNAEIERLRAENEKLLNHILHPNDNQVAQPQPEQELKPILPNRVTWRVRKQMLEEADRAKARAMQNAAKPDEELEDMEKVLLDTSIPTEVALEGTTNA